MFSIKICGVTRSEDVTHAVASGADAIGFNFYPPSPRSVTAAVAEPLVQSMRDENPACTAVGVFVNEPLESIQSTVSSAGLNAVQLHGDESPQIVAALSPWPVIRAFRMKPGDEDAIVKYVHDCAEQHPLAAVLIDAAVPGQFGGTGEKADWHQVAKLHAQLATLGARAPRLVLAGGLTPSNVGDSISVSCADAVDTASGVESAPGIKDPQMVGEFVECAITSFGRRTSK